MADKTPRGGTARANLANQQALGPSTSGSFRLDPKRLVFSLSRYKFVAKLLGAYSPVLEIGCSDAFGSTIVAQGVQRLVGIDVDGELIAHAAENDWLRNRAELRVHDILVGPVPDETFAAAYSLDVIEHIEPENEHLFLHNIDVIEHIEPENEHLFLHNIAMSLVERGVALVGTPNATAAAYASEHSRTYHVNIKTHDGLRESMMRHFRHVFMFGMNDEVVHTGFGPMCHYLFALAVDPRW